MAALEPSSLRVRELAAEAWAELAELIDPQLSPLGLQAMAALAPATGEVIVDIGCGAGQTVAQLAARVGADGQVIGIDVAARLLDVARRRTRDLPQVRLVEVDAAALALPDASVDGVFSRFGVMAFTDATAAFANFRRMLKPAGRLAFVCWRALEENELDLLPLRAAGLESHVDRAPFSFEDPDVVRATLTAAGFGQIAVEAHDAVVSSGGIDAMAEVLLRVGPLGRILRETPELRAAAEPKVRAALAQRGGQSVGLNAAVWIVTGRASS